MSVVRDVPDWRDKVRALLMSRELHFHFTGSLIRLMERESPICIEAPQCCFKLPLRAAKEAD